MPAKFVLKGATQRKARVNSAGQRKVDSDLVAKSLGAEPTGKRSARFLDVLEVREALKSMVRSSGGRPGIVMAADRVKIPRIEEDWVKLEELALKLREPGQSEPRLSLAQVAAVVLHLALEKLPEHEIREAQQSKHGGR